MPKLTELFQGKHNSYVALYLPNARLTLDLPFCPWATHSRDPALFGRTEKYVIFYRPSSDWVTYDYEGLGMQDIEHYWCYNEIMASIMFDEDLCNGPVSVPWRMWVA